jgi:hypothetical protein
MRSCWEALRASLVRSIRTLQADREFCALKSQLRSLEPFGDPGALLAHLHWTAGDLDAKDVILGELVTSVQCRWHRELATALLWLGLWPGLDAVYNRRLKHFQRDPDELVSLIGEAFTLLVERLDLKAVHRVAATLVRSTERDLMAVRRKDWEEEARRASDAEQERFFREKAAEEHSTSERVESELGWRPGHGLTERPSALTSWLMPVVGDDTELLISVLVVEETQREAGHRLGATHDATRKRVQRALGVLRDHLGEPLPSSPERVCPTPGR